MDSYRLKSIQDLIVYLNRYTYLSASQDPGGITFMKEFKNLSQLPRDIQPAYSLLISLQEISNVYSPKETFQ